jgi:hypothetical protein
MPPYVSQVVAIVEEAKARGYTQDDVKQALDKSIEIGARMIREGHHGFCGFTSTLSNAESGTFCVSPTRPHPLETESDSLQLATMMLSRFLASTH